MNSAEIAEFFARVSVPWVLMQCVEFFGSRPAQSMREAMNLETNYYINTA